MVRSFLDGFQDTSGVKEADGDGGGEGVAKTTVFWTSLG